MPLDAQQTSCSMPETSSFGAVENFSWKWMSAHCYVYSQAKGYMHTLAYIHDRNYAPVDRRDRHTHMQILSFVLHWKTSFTLEHSAALHTAVDTWHKATDSLTLTLCRCRCRCHSSSCQAKRLLALQVYFGHRCVFLMYFYSCLRWVGVSQFMCVHKKGSKMLEKDRFITTQFHIIIKSFISNIERSLHWNIVIPLWYCIVFFF